MIPDFDAKGNLPPGIHACSLQQLISRFGSGSSEREAETRELVEFVNWAREAGVIRLIVDGSYVTPKESPNDADVVILPGPEYPRQQQPVLASGQRWPFIHVQVAVDDADFQKWASVDFGLDQRARPRGVVEILL
jgi:hypothetical protein